MGQSKPALGKQPTKKDLVKLAGENISEMLSEIKGMKQDLKVISPTKRKLDDAKSAMLEAKRGESEARRKLSTIKLLKEQLACQLITKEEFKEKCKIEFGM